MADVVDEVQVVPPRRRSRRSDTAIKNSRGASTTSLVTTYDGQNRLVREDGASSSGPTFTTTYTSWDQHGRPTAGRTVSKAAPASAQTLAYSDATRTVTTTADSQGMRMVCEQTFDANGNPAATACRGPAGPSNSAKTTVTTTERICR